MYPVYIHLYTERIEKVLANYLFKVIYKEKPSPVGLHYDFSILGCYMQWENKNPLQVIFRSSQSWLNKHYACCVMWLP